MSEELEPCLSAGLREFSRRDPVVALIRNVVGFDRIEKLLVGGVIRDLALNRPLAGIDVDFLLGNKGAFLDAELGRRLKRRAARLENKDEETWRIVHRDASYDFCILPAGGAVATNLAARDFTVNALAWDLREDCLVDPLGGLDDCRERRLRMPARDAFRRDPLRILRGARFLAVLPGFSLEETTREAMADAASLLAVTAPERIREELLKLLDAPTALPGLRLLEELQLWSCLPGLRGLSVCPTDDWRRHEAILRRERCPGDSPALEARAALRLYLLVSSPAWREHLQGGGVVPDAEAYAAILRQWRCSNREIQFAREIHRRLEQASAMREGGIGDALLKSWIHQLQKEATLLSAILEALGRLADDDFFRGLSERLDGWIAAGIGFHYPRLITGEDLKSMGLGEGPAVGRILQAVQQAQYEGEVSTRRQALDLALRWLDGGEVDDDGGS